MLPKILTVLALVVGSLGEPSTQVLCPRSCNCTYSSISQGVAKCSTLDPEVQPSFPPEIRHLVVENDPNPKNITDSMFFKLGLRQLSSIKIVNSSVITLDIDAFKGLTHLTNVDLSDNRLMLIHPNTFVNNTELRKLILSGNPLQLTQLLLPIGEYVLRSDSLSELFLSRCQMNHLSNHAFSELGDLDSLDLSYNNIRYINPDVFIGLDQLEELDLSFNDLSVIPADTFTNIDDLNSLILRGNPLQTFDLPNLAELKELDLSQCQFTYIGPVTFEGVLEVSSLNLSHNAIEKIDPDAFDAMYNLRYLDLSYNNLVGPLDAFLLEPVPNIETVSFAGNKHLKVLKEFDGVDFISLYFYDISDCSLSTLNGKMFRGMHYLATLNASGNDIDKIESTAFSGLVHIQVLDLSNNRLDHLHPNIFASNHELNKLYLSGNLFHHISVPMFRPLTKLSILDLSSNLLTSLFNHSESGIMESQKILGQLTHLNVARNSIKHLPIFNFFSMVSLQVLDISENPLECNANFIRVVKWLSNHRIIPNAYQARHPMNMIMDDNIENYRKWLNMLDIVCPVNLKEFDEVAPPPHIENHLEDLDEPRVEQVKMNIPDDSVEDSSLFYPEKKIIDVNEDSRYELLEMADDTTEWPTLLLVTVFCVFIFVAFINIGLIMFFRARRNYSLVGYKSTFSGGPLPQSRFPLRKGHRNAYQKLYEDCSIPNTPIVKNGKKLSIISIFGSQTEVPPQHV